MTTVLLESPEFEAKVWGTRELKSFFELANLINDEITIHVVKENFGEGILFRTMDKDHVTLLDVMWDSTNFEKWNVIKQGSFGINTKQACKLIKCFDDKDNVTLSIQDHQLVFTTKTSRETMTLIEPDQATIFDIPIPKVTHNATISISQKVFKNIVKRVDLVSDYIGVDMSWQTIQFSGKGDKGEANMKLEKGMPNIPEFSVKEDSSSDYTVSWIKDFLSCLDEGMVTLNFSSRHPMKISGSLGRNSRVDYWIAHKIVEGRN